MNTTENAYEILGIANGPTASEHDIKKAYRKLALRKHPDKNPDNPNAAAEFALLQKSYDILCDKDARSALDEWLRIQLFKETENAARGEKRRKFAEELERREKGSKRESEEKVAKLKLQRQIERLRQKASDKEQAAYVKRRVEAMKLQKKSTQEESITFEVRWSRDKDVSLESLASMLAGFGTVEQVTQSRAKNRLGALIIMKSCASLHEIETSLGLKDKGIQCNLVALKDVDEITTSRKLESDPPRVDSFPRHGRIFPAARNKTSFELKQRNNQISTIENQIMTKMKDMHKA